MAFDEENCDNNKFEECTKINKAFFDKLNMLVQQVCDLSSLPSGNVSFTTGILGSLTIVHDGTGDPRSTGGDILYYYFSDDSITFSVNDFAYLAKAGEKINLSAMWTGGHYVDTPTLRNDLNAIAPYQIGFRVLVNDVEAYFFVDGYGLNKSGHNSSFAHNAAFEHTLDGNDLKLTMEFAFIADVAGGAVISDSLNVDAATSSIRFDKA